MNRLGNTIKGNCTNAKSCRADILCKVNTSFATTTLLLQGLTARSKLANPTSGAKTTEDRKRHISKHTRPRNKSFGHMTLVLIRETSRGTAPPLTAALFDCAVVAVKTQSLEAVSGRLLEDCSCHCMLTHIKAGTLAYI